MSHEQDRKINVTDKMTMQNRQKSNAKNFFSIINIPDIQFTVIEVNRKLLELYTKKYPITCTTVFYSTFELRILQVVTNVYT